MDTKKLISEYYQSRLDKYIKDPENLSSLDVKIMERIESKKKEMIDYIDSTPEEEIKFISHFIIVRFIRRVAIFTLMVFVMHYTLGQAMELSREISLIVSGVISFGIMSIDN